MSRTTTARHGLDQLAQHGRPCDFADEELATNILQAAQQKDFAMREFIVALAGSRAFQIN